MRSMTRFTYSFLTFVLSEDERWADSIKGTLTELALEKEVRARIFCCIAEYITHV